MERSVYYIKFYKPWQFIIDAWDQAVAEAIAEGEEEEQMATTIALALGRPIKRRETNDVHM